MTKSKKLSRRNDYKPLLLVGLILFTTLFSIGFVSAFEFDNVKKYDKEKKEVTIKNGFGMGSEVAKIRLTSPLNNRVGLGYQKVAEFEIINHGEYNDPLKKLDLYDLRDGNKKISRTTTYKQQIPYDVVVNDYQERPGCSNGYWINNNSFCNSIIVGTHIEERYKWIDLHKDLPAGTYKIGIFTDVQEGDRVEWIPTYYGVEITEWAVWTADLGVDLIHAYNLNEGDTTGSGVMVDAKISQNGTNSGCFNASGVLFSAYQCSQGESDYINFTTNAHLFEGISVSVWARQFSDSGANKCVVCKGNNFIIGTVSGENTGIDALFYDGSWHNAGDNAELSNNTWTHLVATYNTTHLQMYKDGVNVGNTSIVSDIAQTVTAWWMLAFDGGSLDFDGTLDMAYFWNRTLTNPEVIQLYNEGNGLELNESSTTQISPDDNDVVLDALVNFSCNAVSGDDLVNMSLLTNETTWGIKNTTAIIGVSNSTNWFRTLPVGAYLWGCEACNSAECFQSSANRTITFRHLTENSQTYDSAILSGTDGTFEINTTNGQNITLAQLVYNGTNYTGTVYAGDYPTVITNRTITVPTVTTQTNVTFYWDFTLTDGTRVNSTSNNQTINVLSIDNCSTNTDVLYNFTIVDEELQTILNASNETTLGQVDIQIYDLSRANLILNYSVVANQTNPFGICLNDNLSAGASFSIDAQVEYSGLNYAKELYHIQNNTLNSTEFPTNITLYDLNSSDSQEFRILYKDASFLPVEDAIIQIQRKYVGEGLFKVVEIPMTDYNGKTVAHLVLDEVIYNFVVIKNGRILGVFNNVMATCENVVLDNCEITLNSFSSSVPVTDYSTVGDFSFTFFINKTSRVVTSAFIIPSGVPSTVVLNVTMLDTLGTQACSDSLFAINGNLTCTIPSNLGNATAIVTLSKGGEIIGRTTFFLGHDSSDIYGGNLLIVGILLFATLIGIGISSNPMVSGVFLILGVILAVGLNIFDTSGFIGAGATILWFVIAVILVLIKGSGRQ